MGIPTRKEKLLCRANSYRFLSKEIDNGGVGDAEGLALDYLPCDGAAIIALTEADETSQDFKISSG